MKKRKIRTKNRFFTLLEVCVIITLIALTASVLGFRFYDVIKKENTRKSVKLFKNTFQYCQELALLFQADVNLIISQGEEGVFLQIYADEVPNRLLDLKSGLKFRKLQLFLDEEPFSKTVYHFYTNGEMPSKKRLKYLNEQDKMEAIFDN